VGVRALVVNTRHVKQVPGRKTDLADAQWLAILARNALLRGGFVPPGNFPPPAPDRTPDAEVDRAPCRAEQPSA
jgi:hypothetical protein